MACNISITSFSGVGTSQNGDFQSVTVTASVSGCDEVSVEIYQVGASTPLLVTTAFTSGGTVTATLMTPVGRPLSCGQEYRVRVACLADTKCFADEQIMLPCGDDCCVDFTVTPTIGPCVNGERQVCFLVSFTLTDPRCLPYVLAIDFGYNNSFSASHVYTTIGSFSFQECTVYPSSVATEYTVKIKDSLHGSCTETAITLQLDACAPPDCCAIVGPLSAQIGDCDDDCRRPVVLSADFSPPSSPCGPATLQWQIKDQAGITVWNSDAFSTAFASPNVQLPVELSAAGSPYVATLNAIHPTPCAYGSIEIVVPGCNTPPKCPDNLSLSATDLGCQKDGNGTCARKYVFYVDATIYSGCGQGAAATQFNLSFGDGSNVQFSSSGSGHQSFTFYHFYPNGGSPTATLSVIAPSGCQQTSSVTLDVQQCAASDCAVGPPGPPPIECPMCTKCAEYMAKIGASFWRALLCKMAMLAAAIGMATIFAAMATVTGASGTTQVLLFQNVSSFTAGLIASGALFAWVAGLLYLDKNCGNCCLYCAWIAALILSVIFIIIAAISGMTTLTVIIALIILAGIWYSVEIDIKPRCLLELVS